VEPSQAKPSWALFEPQRPNQSSSEGENCRVATVIIDSRRGGYCLVVSRIVNIGVGVASSLQEKAGSLTGGRGKVCNGSAGNVVECCFRWLEIVLLRRGDRKRAVGESSRVETRRERRWVRVSEGERPWEG
jgi:hypothetical protein